MSNTVFALICTQFAILAAWVGWMGYCLGRAAECDARVKAHADTQQH